MLKRQIENFEKAVQLVQESEMLSIELLCQINKALTPEHESSGIIRPVQNWIGKSLEKPDYLPPPPSMLGSLLTRYIEVLNHSELSCEDKAVAAYVNLLRIHPFADGNGRTSRALYSGLLSKSSDIHTPLSLYRLKASPKYYTDFLISPKINSELPITHSYLDEAYQWINNYEAEAYRHLTKTQHIISKKIGFAYMTKEEIAIITLLWRYPILTHSKIRSHLNTDIKKTNDVISKLINCSLITARKIRHKSTTIYVADDVLTCWDELDNSINTTK
jgi:Fic family protein